MLLIVPSQYFCGGSFCFMSWCLNYFVLLAPYVCFHIYTPGIYADGYIAFAFPFVCSFVRSLVPFFVRNSGTFVEFMSKFWSKFL